MQLYRTGNPAVLLAKNCRMSAGKASRHIHHRFFLITDKIEKGDVTVEHRGTKEMWADGNTKPLQGAGFRLFRSKIMGIPEEYDDDAEKVRTHPQLKPKAEKAGVIPSEDLKVLTKALGVEEQDQDDPKVSTPPMTPAKVGRRSVLDNMKFGPGNRPYWEMKEGRTKCRYPDLLRVLSIEQDPRRRRQLFESHKRKLEGTIGRSKTIIEQGRSTASRIEQKKTGVSRQ